MKRLVTLLMVVGLACSACGGDGGSGPVPRDTTDSQSDSQDPDVSGEDVPPADVEPGRDVPAGETGGPDQVTPPADADSVQPPDEVTPACREDNECNDGNPCTVDRCDNGRCRTSLKDCRPENADPCDDWYCDPTTGECEVDRFVNPTCLHPCASNPSICDDQDTCTDDLCNPDTGCYYEARNETCDDGNPCTEGERCTPDAGSVAFCGGGTANACDDRDACTLDWCDPQSGCQHLPLGANCDLSCPGGQGDCPAATPCIEYVCNTGLATPTCEPQFRTGACDDGNACTTGDRCENGVCTGGSPLSCDDGNDCTVDRCRPDTGCYYVPVEACCVPCAIDADCGLSTNPCVQRLCTPGGCCRSVNLLASCDDGQVCTTGDQCENGQCREGLPVECDDDDPLTRDFCVEPHGCQHEPLPVCGGTTGCTSGLDCATGDPCTRASCLTYIPGGLCLCEPIPACHCNPGAVDGGRSACDDGNPCTTDVCERVTDGSFPYPGRCVNTANPGLCCPRPCTREELGPDAPSCDDGVPCTQDICVQALGQDTPTPGDDAFCCVQAPIPPPCGRACTRDSACDDNNPCTVDQCSPTAGDDGQRRCLPPVTDPALCECTVGTVMTDCEDDENRCTTLQCIGNQCVQTYNNEQCSLPGLCWESAWCQEGECVGVPLNCDDRNDCTIDSCDPAVGCVHARDTANPECPANCTVPTAEVDCWDGDPCTRDYCQPDGWCANQRLDYPFCSQMPCREDSDCDDGNPCTSDRCLSNRPTATDVIPLPPEQRACQYTVLPGCTPPETLTCTTNFDCDPARCVPDNAAGAFCRTTPSCIMPWCAGAVGCVFPPGNGCPVGSECSPLTQLTDCDDENGCTEDICDPVSLTCVNQPHSDWVSSPFLSACVSCPDDSGCSLESLPPDVLACLTTRCVKPAGPGGVPAAWGYCVASDEAHPNFCVDRDLCTADVCLPEGGCGHGPLVPGCTQFCSSDGDCDDGDPCTTDVCVGHAYCEHTPIANCVPCNSTADCPAGPCDLARCAQRVCRSEQVPACIEIACTTDAECDDGDPDTVGSCDRTLGACFFLPVSYPCTTINDCQITPQASLDCRRAASCTLNVCVYETIPGCTPRTCHSSVQCQDDNPCTVDYCVTGVCGRQTPNDCCLAHADCESRDEVPAGALWYCNPQKHCVSVGVGALYWTGGACTSDTDCPNPYCTLISDGPSEVSACADWPCAGAGFCDLGAGLCRYAVADCFTCSADHDCVDADPCTRDACVAGACTHTPIAGCTPQACGPTNPCPGSDPCSIPICTSGGCLYVPNPECAP